MLDTFGPVLTLLGLITLRAATVHPAPDSSAGHGVIIESVEPGSLGERMGLRVGDKLVSWRVREPARPVFATHGFYDSPFDVDTFALEIAPRPNVSIVIGRGSARRQLQVRPGRWGLQTRPILSGDNERRYLEALASETNGRAAEAVAVWRQLATQTKSISPATLCWLMSRIGRALDKSGQIEAAEAAFDEARRLSSSVKTPGVDAQLRFARALVRLNHGQTDAGLALPLSDAADAWARAAGQGLAWSYARRRYASALSDRGGNQSEAARMCREALVVQQRLSGESYPTAKTYSQLGTTALRMQNIAGAQRWYERSRGILARIAPISDDYAGVLNNLSIVAAERGDYPGAEKLLNQADAIDKSLAAGGISPSPGALAMSIVNHGAYASEIGDWARADDMYLRALGTMEREAPDSLATAGITFNLGNIALYRGDLAAAETWYRRALAIKQRVAAPDLTSEMQQLSAVLVQRGNLDDAAHLAEQALEIRTAMAPESTIVASALETLAEVRIAQADYESARTMLEKALVYTTRAGERWRQAEILHLLGHLERMSNKFVASERRLKEAIAIREQIVPDGWKLAESLHELGLVLLHEQRVAEGLNCLDRSIDVLDRQRVRVGGIDQSRASFAAKTAPVYADYIDALVDAGDVERAFHVLERSRARVFLDSLSERDVLFSSDIPDALRTERAYAEHDLDDAQSTLAKVSGQNAPSKIRESQGRLRRAEAQLAAVDTRVRLHSPRLAALQHPTPLTVAQARSQLTPQTLLVEFSVGTSRTHVFTIDSGRTLGPVVRVATVAVGRDELAREIVEFRQRLQKPAPEGTETRKLRDIAARLFQQLLAPIESQMTAARRLLIVANGPLHQLPFAALLRDPDADDGYLVGWKPLVVVPSATVYAELRRSAADKPRAARLISAVAFGDPAYPASLRGQPMQRRSGEEPLDAPSAAEPSQGATWPTELQAAVRGGLDLPPLPATRTEALGVQRLFRPHGVAYVGNEATEERAKALSRSTDLVHLAVHATTNDLLPLNSALVFTIPTEVAARENGLLQAWEIFDQVRLNAELVTLSACETALGRDAGGEGLLSLTRAFHYAGARSVLASLWRVDDQATSVLMQRFYENIKAGATKDEALRRAQVAMSREAGHSHPYYWAAFQLSGAPD
jgi:CHAT domain-containing protein